MAKTTIPAGYFAAGSIATADIAANAITSAKLAQNSVLTKHIDDNQVGIDQLNVSDGSDGQVLTTNGSGTLSFSTVTGTTINNNADNRVITGSGTANTLEGESNFVFDASNTRVGIGTASPSQQLSIVTSSGTAYMNLTNGTATMFIGPDSGNTGLLGTSTNHDFRIITNDTERFRIDSSGNVGVGTASPTGHFEVNGGRAGVISTDSSWGQFRIGNSSTAETSMAFVTGATASDFLADGDPACSHKVILGLSPYGAGTTNFGIGNDNIAAYHTYWDQNGHMLPGANNTYDLGSAAKGWRNIYTNDLNLSNMAPEGTDSEGNAYTRPGNDVDGTNGSWTIQEGADDLFIINRINGKKYRFNLTEVTD